MNRTYKAGDEGTTNTGSDYTVIEYLGNCRYLIEFQDEFKYRMPARANRLKEGKIQNPYLRSFKNLGFIGAGSHKASGDSKPAYKKWQDMWARVGSDNPDLSAYADCTISEEWQNFQTFADFYYACRYNEDEWELDKDILVPHNRVYGVEFCVFVPKEINLFIQFNRTKSSALPTGVREAPQPNTWTTSIKVDGKSKHLGTFYSIESAYFAYKLAKEKEAVRIARKWESYVDPRVTESLLNFKVDAYSRYNKKD